MDHKPWETLSTEVINENPWTKFMHDEYVLPNGKKGNYYYMKTPVGSIMIVPVLPSGKIVFVKQFRYLFQKESIEFPAGHGEMGRTVLDVAKAELEEEAGYKAQNWKELPSVAPSIGLLKDTFTSFVATGLSKGQMNPEESEEFQHIEMTVEEVDAAIASGTIWNGLAVTAWALARPHVVEYIESL